MFLCGVFFGGGCMFFFALILKPLAKPVGGKIIFTYQVLSLQYTDSYYLNVYPCVHDLCSLEDMCSRDNTAVLLYKTI